MGFFVNAYKRRVFNFKSVGIPILALAGYSMTIKHIPNYINEKIIFSERSKLAKYY